jgi:hypothetical protein
MDKKLTMAMGILVGIILIAFFLPWVRVESSHVGTVSKLLTGKRQVAIAGMSGFQVPLMANSKESRLAISVIKIFAPKVKNADKKSFLIWFVPGLAVIMAVVCHILNKNKWVHLALGIIGCVLFMFALFKIMTTDLDKLVLNIKIASGLWLTLLGYLGIGIVQMISFVRMTKT